MGAIERAKQVTPPEMNSIIRVSLSFVMSTRCCFVACWLGNFDWGWARFAPSLMEICLWTLISNCQVSIGCVNNIYHIVVFVSLLFNRINSKRINDVVWFAFCKFGEIEI